MLLFHSFTINGHFATGYTVFYEQGIRILLQTVFKALEHMPTNQDAFLIFWRTTKLCCVADILFHIYISYISTAQRSWFHITWFDSSHLGLWSVPAHSTIRQVIELAFTSGYCKFIPKGISCSPAALGKQRTGSLTYTHWGHMRI